jgi:class 3 adenylate cyclase
LTAAQCWRSIGTVEPPAQPASPGHGAPAGTPRPLPAGTVTFLFTDIEGSTALITRLGSAYEPLLEAHRGILRAAFDVAGGVEVQTEGDAFFVVFASASAAAAACVAAQRALVAYPWPSDSRIRVLLGLL